jgi:hypothetical protein
MGRTLDDEHLIRHLGALVSASSYRKIGELLGFNASFIFRVLSGRNQLTEKLGDALGYEPAPRGWKKKGKL